MARMSALVASLMAIRAMAVAFSWNPPLAYSKKRFFARDTRVVKIYRSNPRSPFCTSATTPSSIVTTFRKLRLPRLYTHSSRYTSVG